MKATNIYNFARIAQPLKYDPQLPIALAKRRSNVSSSKGDYVFNNNLVVFGRLAVAIKIVTPLLVYWSYRRKQRWSFEYGYL